MTGPELSFFYLYSIISVTIITAVLTTPWSSDDIYPLCDHYQDKEGIWMRTKDNNNKNNNRMILSQEEEEEMNKHFFLQPPGEALEFNQTWLPTSCSYHRFTNTSFYQMIDNLLTHPKYHHLFPNKQVHIALLGDSATRSVFCGLSRILAGSELYGPCDNVVCGGTSGLPVSVKKANRIYEVDFSPTFKITYSYIYDIDDQHHSGGSVIERVINPPDVKNYNRPYAIVVNSGAWDFDQLWRSNNEYYNTSDNSEGDCNTVEASRISHERASNKIINKMKYLSDIAHKHHIRLIYRNNHYNSRFGPICADRLLEERMKIIPHSVWEVWDNRGISKDVWKEQCYDGFHFDRHRVHSSDHHRSHMSLFKTKGGDLRGQLEIQLAQSLLNGIFYQYLADEYHRIYGGVRPKESEEKKRKKKKESESLSSAMANATNNGTSQRKKIPLGFHIIEIDEKEEEKESAEKSRERS